MSRFLRADGGSKIVILVLLTTVTIALAAVAGSATALLPSTAQTPSAPAESPELPELPRRGYLRSACSLPHEWVKRLARGYEPARARGKDLIVVTRQPHYMGTWTNTPHSGPYPELQEVPLIFYGPGFVEPQGTVSIDREVTVADIVPTYARLMNFRFPERSGRPVTAILKDTARSPALIVTISIDGGGWNVLRQWPQAWPNISHLVAQGASIQSAIVGSSPSITPAVHTTIGTGAFPRQHGVLGISVRDESGDREGAFTKRPGDFAAPEMDPRLTLDITTLADLWDRARSNRPRAGIVTTGNLPLGMLGHGSALRGGDRDVAAIQYKQEWKTNPAFYRLPTYISDIDSAPYVSEVDRQDGQADGKWRGHEFGAAIDTTPALAPWQNAITKAIVRNEGFGADRLTDLLFINYKAPDKAGHLWNMTAPEQGEVLQSVDTAIGDLKSWLDDNVGPERYLIALTADHGQTPLGGWPVSPAELEKDVNRRFDRVKNGRAILQETSATMYFTSAPEMKLNDVAPEQIATFFTRYTIRDNVKRGADVPPTFRNRLDERVFQAAFPARRLGRIKACTGNGATD